VKRFHDGRRSNSLGCSFVTSAFFFLWRKIASVDKAVSEAVLVDRVDPMETAKATADLRKETMWETIGET
jgi:tRNA(His) 5'-end guanylyltransferase